MTLREGLRERVRSMMEVHWQPEGYTVPNAATYPFQWLWDSCFHSLIWAELGDADRALIELAHVFRTQDDDGFVPHIDYERDPELLAAFWGRAGASSITQPPVHGHTIAALGRRGVAVPDELLERSRAHLAWLLRERRHESGLIAVRHPWETGCDDSPRFDAWGAADAARWYTVKGELVASLPDNGFDCAPVSLSSITAWACRELDVADEGLGAAVASRWDGDRRTWVDGGAGEATSGRARTLDGLLGLLVDDRREAVADLADAAAYSGAHGPRGVHIGEATFDRRRYWRGPVWPQLAYLLWQAGAVSVGEPTVRGAVASGLAEYWDPEDGTGLGAIPQSWTGLVLLLTA